MGFIKGLFREHKLKMLGVIAFALVFGFLIFPYDDLADLATAKVSEMTGNTVYLQFDSLDINAVPVGVGLENVAVETTTLPAIKASSLTVSPWVSGALIGKQGASVDATGLFGGAVVADYRDGDKTESGARFKSIAVDASGLKLPEVMKYLRDGGLLSLLLQGTLDLNTAMVVDPEFATQPNGELGFAIKNFTLPSQTLAVSMMPGGPAMPLPVPEMKLGTTKLAAKMSEGSLQISDFSFGGDPKGLSGKVTGQMGLSFRGGPAGIQPVIGAYDLRINLKLPKEFVQANERAGLSLAFAMLPPTARKDLPDGTQLAFRLQPPAPGQGVPQITAIQ